MIDFKMFVQLNTEFNSRWIGNTLILPQIKKNPARRRVQLSVSTTIFRLIKIVQIISNNLIYKKKTTNYYISTQSTYFSYQANLN